MSADEKIGEDARASATGFSVLGKSLAGEEEGGAGDGKDFDSGLGDEVVEVFDALVADAEFGIYDVVDIKRPG